MGKDVSYSMPENSANSLGSDTQLSAEECSNSCAEGLGFKMGCTRFTWSVRDGKKCMYYKDEGLVEQFDFGSYSGLPRQEGELSKLNIRYEHLA